MPPLRVLLIEDSPVSAPLVPEIHAEYPGEVEFTSVNTLLGAVDALACSEPCTDHAWDAVVLDLHLPNGTGLSCIRTVRALCSKAALIVYTDLHDEELRACFDAGADDFLAKRSSAKQMMATIIRASRQTASARHRESQWSILRDAAELLERGTDALRSAPVTGRFQMYDATCVEVD